MKKIVIGILLLSSFIFGADYTSKLLGDTKGNLIINENIYEIHPFASLTKIMTSVLVVEEVEKGKIAYTDMVTVPKKALENKGSSVFLKAGEKVSVSDLLYATMVHSANDAAYTLAYYVSKGNVTKFVANMNKKAKEIGMINTKFCTPNGLPPSMTGKGMDEGTANDMYKLSMYAIKKKKILEVAGTKKITIFPRKLTIVSRNSLLTDVEGVYGLKTGFHDGAKYNISVAFKKDNVDYIIILFGGKNSSTRDNEVKKTITNFSPLNVKDEFIYVNSEIDLYNKNVKTPEPKEVIDYKNIDIFFKPDEITKKISYERKGNNSGFDGPIIITD